MTSGWLDSVASWNFRERAGTKGIRSLPSEGRFGPFYGHLIQGFK
jgi:hypothetical protein